MEHRHIFSILFLGALIAVAGSIPPITALFGPQSSCRVEKVTLIRQYLADEPELPQYGLEGCHQCLHIVVQRGGGLPNTYILTHDHQLKPWKKGDILEIQWCNVGGAWRIQGVKKIGEVKT